jgi:D-aspartate ligase
VTTERPFPSIPVLIFGAHIVGLGVLRTLARRGVECYVVDGASDIIVRSRWYRPAERQLAETKDSRELDDYLQSLRLPRAVLIPCSDGWSLAVAGLPAATRERFPASMPTRGTLEQFVDKDLFSALVDRTAIPHPRSVPLRGPEDLDHITDAELKNAFLKPTDSQNHRRVFGKKGSFVETHEAAVRLMERGRAEDVSFLLQEWIPGDMAATILIEGFVDRNGQVAGMVPRRRVRVNPPMIGNTVSSVTIPLAEVDGATAALRRLLAEVAYRGAFNVEFKFDVRDGQFKIIELNPRPAWYISSIASAGLDLSWMIYLDAQGLPVEAQSSYQTGRYAMFEFGDAKALMRELRSFRRPEGPVLGPWLRGDHLVFWWRDPLPVLDGVWKAIGRRVRRAREKLLRRSPTSAR